MMKKVLLVDDEAYILNLMEKMIEWEFYGFQIIGKAENAADALKIFRSETPDIIITDICMEQISGIEFITRIRMQNSQVKVIILSAYDKFEYAQKAFRLNVDGYLLKPINKEELLDTLLEVQNKLESREEYQDRISYLENSLDSLQRKYLEGYLLRIYAGEVTELPKDAQQNGTWYVLSIRTIDRKEIVFLENDLKKSAEVESFVLFVGDGLFAVFLLEKEKSGKARKLIDRLKCRYCDIDKTIMCGVGTDEEGSIGKMCYRSRRALNSLFYEKDSYYCEIKDDSGYIEGIVEFSKEKMLLFMVNREREACKRYLREYIAECKRLNAESEVVFRIFRECIQTAKSAVKDRKVREELDNICREAGNEFHSIGLMELFNKCMLYVESGNMQLNKAGIIITNAREYIKKQGLEESFSIDMLAQYLNISKSYLSKLYKEETGESIWNYVMRLRIAKAKELLVRTDATNFAIAKAIGYSSEYHFSRAFSKTVGMPPSTYKKMYLQMEDRQNGIFDKKE